MKLYCKELLERVPSLQKNKLQRLAQEDNMYEKIVTMTSYQISPIFSQRLFDIVNGLHKLSVCYCGEPLKFKSFKEGYKKFCSVKCSRLSESTQTKQKETTLKRYGVENISQSKLIKEKKQATCIRNHGVAYGMQSEKIREKTKASNMKKYGVSNTFQLPQTKLSVKDKFGVYNVFSSDKIKNKIKHTNLKKYGVENPNQSPIIKKKSRETRENKGDWTKLEEMTDFEYYKNKVRLLTEKAYRKNKLLLEKENKRSINYQLDHRISIYQGFHNRIPIHIISDINNLEIISRSNNAKKHVSCSITIEELFYKIFNV